MISNSWFHLFIFLSGVPSFSRLYHFKASPNLCKASILFFSSFTSFDHSFITGVLHGGSTWWFIKDVIPSRSVHRDSFQRSSSILHLAFQSEIISILSFEVVLCYFWQSLCISWSTSCPGWHIVNPSFSIRSWDPLQSINIFIRVILGYISPKAFPKDCCYLWCL